jgi:hypothetical protein
MTTDTITPITLTLILLHQPETTATFGTNWQYSQTVVCHSNYDLSTRTLIRSSELAIKTPVILPKIINGCHGKLSMPSATHAHAQ